MSGDDQGRRGNAATKAWTKWIGSLYENRGATNVALTTNDLDQIRKATASITVHGARYPEHLQRRVGR
jgi:hypothetical protein